MTDDPEIVKLLALLEKTPISGVPDLIRQAFHAGGENAGGRMRQIERALKQVGFVPMSAAAKVAFAPSGDPSQPSPIVYGAISRPVRQALHAMGERRGGVSARQVLDYILKHDPQSNIVIAQVRTCLKQFLGRDEVKRLKRGKYAPGPKMSKPEPAVPSAVVTMN